MKPEIFSSNTEGKMQPHFEQGHCHATLEDLVAIQLCVNTSTSNAEIAPFNDTCVRYFRFQQF